MYPTGREVNSDDPAIAGGQILFATSPTADTIEPAPDQDPFESFRSEFCALINIPISSTVIFPSYQEAMRNICSLVSESTVAEDPTLLVSAFGLPKFARHLKESDLNYQFVDIEPDSYGISPRGIVQKIEDIPGVAGIVIGHPFGHPANMPALERISSDYSIPLIQDCSSAFLAESQGMPVGKTGYASIFSLPQALGVDGYSPELDDLTLVIFEDSDETRPLGLSANTANTNHRATMEILLTALRDFPDQLHRRRSMIWELNARLRGIASVARMSHGRRIQHAYSKFSLKIRGPGWKEDLETSIRAFQVENLEFSSANSELSVSQAGMDSSDQFPVALRTARDSIILDLHNGFSESDVDRISFVTRRIVSWACRS